MSSIRTLELRSYKAFGRVTEEGYHVAIGLNMGGNPDVVSYLVDRAKLFDLVIARRKRHRDIEQISQQIWQSVPLS